jgi:type IV secretory pathway VirB10-like protein
MTLIAHTLPTLALWCQIVSDSVAEGDYSRAQADAIAQLVKSYAAAAGVRGAAKPAPPPPVSASAAATRSPPPPPPAPAPAPAPASAATALTPAEQAAAEAEARELWAEVKQGNIPMAEVQDVRHSSFLRPRMYPNPSREPLHSCLFVRLSTTRSKMAFTRAP